MKDLQMYSGSVVLFVLVLTLGCGTGTPESTDAEVEVVANGPGTYQVDPFWPKPLPNNWLLGEVSGVAIDSHDHVWIIQRPNSLEPAELQATQDPPGAECCAPAPSVLEFDGEGNFIQGWGGPGEGYEWPKTEHGIFVDYMDNVWIGGNGNDDHQVLKFSRDGTFLLQIGQAGVNEGSNSTQFLGKPADTEVDPETNEVYIADGYGNKRVIVFDADTGEYRRHWGAYGNEPDDTPPGDYDPDAPTAQQFRNPVHCVRIADDGLVYVCDRANNRIQVFQKDGTFVKEGFIAKRTLGAGSVWDLDLSTDQVLLYNADGANQKIWTLTKDDLQIVGSFGRHGRYAGQFHWIHNVVTDSQGNIYTTEVNTGRRVQKFAYENQVSASD